MEKIDDGLIYNDVELPYVKHEELITRYDEDQLFGPVVKAMEDKWPDDQIRRRELEKIVPMFKNDGKRLFYNEKLCITRKSVSEVLQLEHDSKICGHFKFAKTLSILSNFYWRHKSRDVRKYVEGFVGFKQFKDSNQKKLTDPDTLEQPERRWSSLGTEFILSLLMSKCRFDLITTWVDRLTRRVHVLSCTTNETAEDTANAFFSNIFKHHGMPDSTTSDRNTKFTSKFWDHVMKRCGVKLKMSASKHPQTVGAIELMNRMVEHYPRRYCPYHQNDWEKLLPAAEFAYNSPLIEDHGMSPFEMDL